MMLLLNLWLILSLSEAAPLISNMDKEVPEEDIVTDDIQSVDIVNGDGMDSDELHSHTSHNTSRDAKHIFYGGNINFSGTIHATGDHARINIGSISSNALSQEPHDEPDSQGCTDDQFLCPSGKCINNNLRCDGDSDCEDGSDEIKCEEDTGCTDDQFSCPSGKCIHNKRRCNGYSDCEDGSDEIKCEEDTGCTSDQFSCKNGECIDNDLRCDEEDNCKDGSDEIDCDIGCTSDQFSCKNGECIDNDLRCDEGDDCKDGSDEIDCDIVCDEFLSKTDCSCENSNGKSVCSAGQRCTKDGCQDGCEADQLLCSSGDECFPQVGKCDDEQDCTDNSDEEDCPNSEKRRKRSTETVTVSGKIVLPANLDFTFPTNSRVYVTCDDISNLQSTNLGIAVIDVSNKPSEEDISYVLKVDQPNSKQITMSATINKGWNRDPSSEEWIRKGDFHNDVSHSLDVVEDTAEYEKDISVVLYY